MKDLIIMKKKENDQIPVFEQLKNGLISIGQAALILKLSLRQIKRKLKKYFEVGPKSLIHGNRGKKSNNKLSSELYLRILSILKNEFYGFAPTFATEKLKERYQINVSRETIRMIMIDQGLWKGRKQKAIRRQWRERKHCLGQMIQLDGSEHLWFNDTYYTLILFIDDATSKILYAEFVKSESLESITVATKKYLEKHGRPVCLYVDRGKVFKINIGKKKNESITQYHRMLEELGIELSFAYSPQAKGRVERSFRTHQDRLVKELKIRKINNLYEANKFLLDYYIPLHNEKYAVIPKEPANVHRSIEGYDLNSIFCRKYYRILKKDSTIVYLNRWFLLSKRQPVRLMANQRITVAIAFDNTINLMAFGHCLEFKEIQKQVPRKKQKKERTINEKYSKPSLSHPWRKPVNDISTLRKK